MEAAPRVARRRFRSSFRTLRDFLLRGGRLTKVAGEVASYAPSLASSVAAIILGAGFGGAVLTGLTASQALAACTETPSGSGVYICSGTNTITASQNLMINKTTDLSVTLNAETPVNPTTDTLAFDLDQRGAGGIVFTQSAAGQSLTARRGVIRARNWGGGAISITVTGTLTANRGNGIRASQEDNSGGSITISAAGDVTGTVVGVWAKADKGTGSVSISAAGVVTGGTRDAIYGTTSASGGALTITAATATGISYGVRAVGLGTGAVAVTLSGSATSSIRASDNRSEDSAAVFVQGGANATGVNVAIASATGSEGLRVTHAGSGELTVSASGDVKGAEEHGVLVKRTSAGSATILLSGSVTGAGTAASVETQVLSGNAANVTLGSGARVGGGAAQTALLDTVGNASVTVNTGATVVGKIILGSGADTLAFVGGTFSEVTEMQGGDGSDTLKFSGGSTSGSLHATVQQQGLKGWESVVIESGAAIGGTVRLAADSGNLTLDNADISVVGTLAGGAGTANTLALDNLSGSLNGANLTGWETVSIGAGSSITLGTATHGLRAGSLDVAGTLNVGADSDITDQLTVTGNFEGDDGTIVLNANFADGGSDKLIITGNATGSANVVLDGLGTLAPGEGPQDRPARIDGVITVQGNVSAGAFSATSVHFGVVAYQLSFDDQNDEFDLVRLGGSSCTESAQGSGVFTCSGAETFELAQTLSASGATNLAVTLNSETPVNTAGTAFSLTQTGNGSIQFTQSASTIAEIVGAAGVIEATNSGGGDITISANSTLKTTADNATAVKAVNEDSSGDAVVISVGSVNVTGNSGHAIEVKNDGAGKTDITATGHVNGGGDGIRIFDGAQNNSANASLTITVGGVSGGWVGMRLRHRGGGDVSVVATGAVVSRQTGGSDQAILLENRTGASSVTLSVATVTASAGRGEAIKVEQHASGPVTITGAGRITRSGNDNAHTVLLVRKSTGTASLTFTGAITADHRGDAINIEDAEGDANAAAASLFISVAAATGSWAGLRIKHRKGGDVTIIATGAVTSKGGGDKAISLINDDHASNLKITAATVTAQGNQGGAHGIYVDQQHGGTVEINAGGPVTTSGGHGIFVKQGGGDAVTINVTGVVTGDDDDDESAIKVEAGGNDAVTINLNSGAVVGSANEDAVVETGGNTTVSVKSNAEVKGAIKLGGGSDRVILAGGTAGGSIDFGAGADTLEVTASGAVSIPTVSGLETLSLGANADVSSAVALSENGSDVGVTLATGTDVAVTTGVAFTMSQTGAGGITFTQSANGQTLSGQSGVISATNSGAGNISITATGELSKTGSAGNTLNAVNEDSAGGDIVISVATVTGTTGGGNAIRVKNDGAGKTDITATGHVNGGGDGIRFDGDENNNANTSLTIDVAAVTGKFVGIRIDHKGAGDVSITATGAVASTNTSTSGPGVSDPGIALTNRNGASSVTLSVAAVTASAARGEAIKVEQHASGPVTITGTGAITRGGTGNAHVVRLVRKSTGTASLSFTGAITASGNGDAINIEDAAGDANAAAASLFISVAAATGGWAGLRIKHRKGGDVTIIATGTVTSEGGGDKAISLVNETHASNLKVTAATVTAQGTNGGDDGATGIFVHQKHGGTVEINAGGPVTSSGGHGIFVKQEGDGAVTINVTGTVTGDDDDNESAIKVAAGGNDAVTINLNSGAVVGSANEDAVVETDGNATVNVKSDAEVKGAIKLGGGNDTLEFSGGTFANSASLDGGAGTDALTFGGGTSGTLGGATGWETVDIEARSSITFGTGVHSLTAGTLSVAEGGTLDVGKDTDISDALTVSGNFDSSSGTVTLNANFVDGGSDTLTITGNVTGTTNVAVTGLGQLGNNQTDDDRPAKIAGVVTVQGTVDANAFAGSVAVGEITYLLRADGTGKIFDLIKIVPSDCRAATGTPGAFVCSGTDVIDATKSLNATGTATLSVTLNSETGIDASGSAFVLTQTGGTGGISFTQSAGGQAIKGASSAITASNSGGGAISIDVNGAVTGAAGDGISATNNAGGSGINVTAVSVSGAESGISVEEGGSGAVSVLATGTVTGASKYGIYAKTGASGGAITVTAAAVTGGKVGIKASASGAGAVSVNATGAVKGTADDGIFVDHDGTGATTIAVSNSVTGGTGANDAAIRTDVSAGRSVTVTLDSGASVGTTTGTPNAILGSAGNTTVTVNTGATIAGKVSLGAGTDELTFAGGTFTSVTEMDGGAGSGDTLTFRRTRGTVSLNTTVVNDGLKGWEKVFVESGATISGAIKLADTGDLTLDNTDITNIATLTGGAGTNTLELKNVTGTLTGANVTGWEKVSVVGTSSNISFGTGTHDLTAGTLEVADGATLDVGDDGDASDALTVSGNFEGGGKVTLDVNFAPNAGASDSLTITGNASGVTTIDVSNISATNGVTDTNRPTLITGVVTVQGTVPANAFTAAGDLTFGAVAYQLKFDATAKRFDLERVFTNKCELTTGQGAGAGVYTCGGVNQIGAAQPLSASGTTALSVTLNSETPIDTAGTAFTLTQSGGNGGIDFDQSASGEQIKGAMSAIIATNTGGGAISINVNGTVTGVAGDGISATNDASGSGITITAVSVSGAQSGIKAVERGDGAVKIVATGTVTGTGTAGIQVDAGDDTGAVTITAATVTGGANAHGIHVKRTGGGTVSISATDAVTGGSGAHGIYAELGSNSGAVTVTAAAVTGGNRGIYLKGKDGGSNLSVSVSGAVSGGTEDGAYLYAFTGGAKATVETTANVTGGTRGLAVTADGAITVNVSGTVHGGTRGLFMKHFEGSERIQATISGSVTSGSASGGQAIRIEGKEAAVTVTLDSGAWIGAKGTVSRTAIHATDTSNVTVTVKSGAVVSGEIQLGDGTDTLTFAGGTFGSVTEMDGGTGAGDTLKFSKGSGSLHATVVQDGLKGWESIVVESGATISGAIKLADIGDLTFDNASIANIATLTGGTGTNTLEFNNVSGSLNGANVTGWEKVSVVGTSSIIGFGTGTHGLTAGTLEVANGATLDVGDDGDASDALTVSGNFEGGGKVTLDVNFAPNAGASDSLTITGNASGVTTIDVSNISATSGVDNTSRPTLITGVVTVGGTVDASAFTATGELSFGAVAYRLKFDATAKRFDLERVFSNECRLTTGEGAGAGVYTCSGVNQIGAAQPLSASANTALSVTLNSETPIDTAGTAFTLAQSGGNGGIIFTQSASGERIKGAMSAIIATNTGGGAIEINVNGTVTGAAGDGISATNDTSGSGITINAVSVSGAQSGIEADEGGGDVKIAATGTVTGAADYGIYAKTGTSGGTITVTAAAVAGGKVGIKASASGSGAVSIKATGAVAGTATAGIQLIDGAKTTDATIDAVAVSGKSGIDARHGGTGKLDVKTTGAVSGTGTGGMGIYGLVSNSSGGVLNITATSTVSGSAVGIKAVSSGTGDVTVEAGTVTATGANGIGIDASASGGDVIISAAAVTGTGTGVKVKAISTGNVSISASGAVRGTAGDGIFVDHDGSGATTVTVTTAVTGGTGGSVAAIRTDAQSNSTVTIDLNSGASVGTTTGTPNAIMGGAGATTVTVNSNATIAGKVSLGAGNDTLTFAGGAFSAVTEMQGGAGTDTLRFSGGSGSLHATVRSQGLKGWESIVVESGATVSGDIKLADDSGNLTLDSATLGSSISLDGGGGAANTLTLNNMSGSISSANVTGWETIGIGAGSSITFGTGTHSTSLETLRVSAGGTLDVGNDTDTGDALTVSGDFAGGGTVTLNVNFDPNAIAKDTLTISGAATGTTTLRIFKIAETSSISDASRPQTIAGVITVTGSVSANAFVARGDVSFGAIGYQLKFNAGVGGAASTFDLEKASANECEETSAGSGVFVCSGTRTVGVTQSLSASGATALSVRLNSETPVDIGGIAFALTQTGGNGGIIFNQSAAGQAISGASSAIVAANSGGGAVSINVNGAVSGTAAYGISASDGASGAGITVTAASVSGGKSGIRAVGSGTGAVKIDATGTVTGSSEDGVYAKTGTSGGAITVTAAAVAGGKVGIKVSAGGQAAVSVKTTGAVVGTGTAGIQLVGGARVTDMAIDAAAVSGKTGIDARHGGTGKLDVKATGAVSGGRGGMGIYGLVSNASGGALTITAAAVSGNSAGIKAVSSGSGAVSVTATGTVSANGGRSAGIKVEGRGSGAVNVTATGGVSARSGGGIGVDVDVGANAGPVAISIGTVNANARGVKLVSRSASSATVSLSGLIKTEDTNTYQSWGVEARAEGQGSLTLSIAGEIDAEYLGVHAESRGSGALSISARHVSAATAVKAIGGTATNGVTVTVGSAYGDNFGVDAQHSGAGDLSITTTGNVAGTRGAAIKAVGSNAVNVKVNAGGSDLRTGRHPDFVIVAIDALASGSGDITITAASLRSKNAGIKAVSKGAGDVSISVTGPVQGVENSLLGLQDGIFVDQDGSGDTSVSVSGRIQAGTAINTDVPAGSDVTISLDSGASVVGQGKAPGRGDVIREGFGAAIVGRKGDTTVTVNTGATLVGSVSLGAGADRLTFAGGAFSRATVLDGGADNDTLRFAKGSGTLSGGNPINWERIEIASGASVAFGSGTLTVGTLDVRGMLDVGKDGDTTDALTLSGTFAGGNGTVALDTNFADGGTDRLTISGNVTGTTRLDIAQIGTLGTGEKRPPSIAGVIKVQGSVSEGAFTWAGAAFGDISYRLRFVEASKTFDLVQTFANECEASGVSGVYTCSGASRIGETQSLSASGATALSVTLNAETVVNVVFGTAFALSQTGGSGGISFTQSANGREIRGAGGGIAATNSGGGAISISVSGTVAADGGDGIAASADGGSVTVSAAGVTGSATGIKVEATGAGSVSISASGAVTGTGANGIGIDASASGGDVTISAAAVTGTGTGVKVKAAGTGNVSISASGAVMGTGANGIGIDASASGGDVTISAAAVTGTGTGVKVKAAGTGNVSISASGSVMGTGGDGIFVDHDGSGATTVTVTTAVAGGTGVSVAAIRTDAQSNSTVTIDLNSGASVGTTTGTPNAIMGGAGATTVTVNSNATIAGKVSLGAGNDTLTFAGGAFSDVTEMQGGAGTDTLRFSGGSGSLHATVRSQGLKGWESIVVESGATVSGDIKLANDSGNLTLDGATLGSKLDGGGGAANTLTLNNMSGSISSANVTGWETIGIGAGSLISFVTGTHSTSLETLRVAAEGTLDVGNDTDTDDALTVSGDFAGGGTVTLNVNFDPNAIAKDTLTITGDVTGTTTLRIVKIAETGSISDASRPQTITGVISVAGAVSGNAFVAAGDVVFGAIGYRLSFNRGTGGASTFDLVKYFTNKCEAVPGTPGAFTCDGRNQIGASQSLGASGSAALAVTLDALTAADTGGTAFALTQTGGTGGIAFTQSANGASVKGVESGIAAVNSGGGAISISVNGTVTGAVKYGISAVNDDLGGDISIAAAAVAGGAAGIRALSSGTGAVSIETTGRVSATGAAGIGIIASATGGDVTVTAAAVAGAATGIRVSATGTGGASVFASGAVTGTGSDGIFVKHDGSGATTITVSSAVTGGTGAGVAAIRTDVSSGGATVALNSGASVGAGTSNAIVGSGGNTAVTVNAGAAIVGKVRLGGGTDTLTFAGGTFSNVIEMDGGDGTGDTLTFSAGSGSLRAEVVRDGLKGWERIIVQSGATLSGAIKLADSSDSLTLDGTDIDGIGSLTGGGGALSLSNVSGSLNGAGVTGWETVRIGANSSITLGAGRLAAGTLSVASGATLAVGNNADSDDHLMVSGHFAGGGRVILDADFAGDGSVRDRLTISGDATGATTVDFIPINETSFVVDDDRPERITGVINVMGTVSASAFIAGGDITFGAYRYDLQVDGTGKKFDLVRVLANNCEPVSGSSGAFSCSGARQIGTPQSLGTDGSTALTVTLGAGTEVRTRGTGSAFSMKQSGAAGITFRQESGGSGITAGRDGFNAANAGGGSVAIAATGTITAGRDGVSVSNGPGGGDARVAVATVDAGGDGVSVYSNGSGGVTVTASGSITAERDGVSAVGGAAVSGVNVTVATVDAGGDGVSVYGAGGGVAVTAGSVKGGDAGIRVRTGSRATGVAITAGPVEGGKSSGISVEHGGGGHTRISATGSVTGADSGVYIRGGGRLTVDASGAVLGRRGDGIHARGDAAAQISVSVSAEVTGGAVAGKAAIRTDSADGTTTVVLESGASVRASASGKAIMDGRGAATVTVRSGASIRGGVSLGAGADELVLAGGDFSGITTIDGGPGHDTLRITAGSGSLAALSGDGAGTTGVESVVVSGSARLSGNVEVSEGTAELVFADGAQIGGDGKLAGAGAARLVFRGVSGELDVSRLSNWSAVEIGDGSRVSLSGSTLGEAAADSLSVAGTMAFGSGGRADDRFTVEGDLSGGGGRVEIDANLATGSTDRLVVEGDVSGTTGIAINNITPSAGRHSSGEIEIVSVRGKADASAFRLEGDAIPAGAFTYDLRYISDGGRFVLRPGDRVSDTGAALRSSPAAIASGFAAATALSARTAARSPSAAIGAGIGSAATFGERGSAIVGQGAVNMAAADTRSVWMRFYSDKREFGADAVGGDAEIDSSGFQFGIDLFVREAAAGKWIAGLTAQYGTVKAETQGGGGAGRQESSGQSVGATLSWLGYGGFYADAQAQLGAVDSDYSSDTMGVVGSGVSAGTSLLALEAGWRIAVGEGATLVPQGQLGMSSVRSDGFTSGSLDVESGTATSLDGRVGLAAEFAVPGGGVRVSGNLWRTLSEPDGTVVNGKTVEPGGPDGWAEFGVGGSFDLNDDTVLFLDGTWRTGVGDGDASGASISGGLKLNW